MSVRSRAGSFVEGGTPNPSSLVQDVEDIREVLLACEVDHVDVVAWGTGGARRSPWRRSWGSR